ncbi:single-stranded DNA-binding protein [Ralstonia sp. ASV6]|uniref:single-stranded DNA-binding protein n=1 Tax=Ralstonia sp. ASV6 TaxID=2795124 RepID=UPI0018ECB831|nr:single-stranded DNA-binding protein [Ralstonia sp. ASV6]
MTIRGELEMTQIGFLADNPQFRKNPDGSKVANFRVITNVTWKDKNTQEEVSRAEGFPYELWGESAEIFADMMKKGYRVYVKGEPRNEKYELDGVTRYGVRIRVTKWENLTKIDRPDQATGGEAERLDDIPA